MDSSHEIQRALDEAKAERDRSILDAEEKYRKTIKAIQDVAGLGYSVSPARPRQAPKNKDNSLRPPLALAVRAVVTGLNQEFTIYDVETLLNHTIPGISPPEKRASLSRALLRLADDQTISIADRGRGSKPTIYRPSSCNSEGGEHSCDTLTC